jgi:hypothetical protein
MLLHLGTMGSTNARSTYLSTIQAWMLIGQARAVQKDRIIGIEKQLRVHLELRSNSLHNRDQDHIRSPFSTEEATKQRAFPFIHLGLNGEPSEVTYCDTKVTSLNKKKHIG